MENSGIQKTRVRTQQNRKLIYGANSSSYSRDFFQYSCVNLCSESLALCSLSTVFSLLSLFSQLIKHIIFSLCVTFLSGLKQILGETPVVLLCTQFRLNQVTKLFFFFIWVTKSDSWLKPVLLIILIALLCNIYIGCIFLLDVFPHTSTHYVIKGSLQAQSVVYEIFDFIQCHNWFKIFFSNVFNMWLPEYYIIYYLLLP